MQRTMWAGLALIAAMACGDSTGVEPEDLAGTWTATSATFTSVADPTLSVELIAAGFGLVLVIQSNGSVTLTFTELNGLMDTDNGTIAVDGSNVTLTIDGDMSSGTISRTENTLTINLTSGVEFDFDDDGVDEDATFRGSFVKS